MSLTLDQRRKRIAERIEKLSHEEQLEVAVVAGRRLMQDPKKGSDRDIIGYLEEALDERT